MFTAKKKEKAGVFWLCVLVVCLTLKPWSEAQLTSDQPAGVLGRVRQAEAAQVLLGLDAHTPEKLQSQRFKAAAAGRMQLIDVGALPPTQHQHGRPPAPGGAARTGLVIVFIVCLLQPRAGIRTQNTCPLVKLFRLLNRHKG